MITEIKGDLLETDCKVIAHGVNCQNTMGSGVARALYEKWPEVKSHYHSEFDANYNFGLVEDNSDFLGRIQCVWLDDDKIVINCFTQEHFGSDGGRYLDYDAIYECMDNIRRFCKRQQINEIAIPKIGCGLAGGDWNIVKAILNSVFSQDFQVKVYIKD